MAICENSKPGREKSKCKGPGTGLCLRNREDASMAGGREGREEVEISRPGSILGFLVRTWSFARSDVGAMFRAEE